MNLKLVLLFGSKFLVFNPTIDEQTACFVNKHWRLLKNPMPEYLVDNKNTSRTVLPKRLNCADGNGLNILFEGDQTKFAAKYFKEKNIKFTIFVKGN